MALLSQYNRLRAQELRARLADDALPDSWYESAAVALNAKLADTGDVVLPNEPDKLKMELDSIIEEYGDIGA
jgi:hypothetical protein